MQQVLLAAEAAKKLLKTALIAARKANLSTTEAARQIMKALESEGMGRGFLPLEYVSVTEKLQSASVVIGFTDYTEVQISAC